MHTCPTIGALTNALCASRSSLFTGTTIAHPEAKRDITSSSLQVCESTPVTGPEPFVPTC